MVETYREIQTTEVDSGSPLTAELTEAFRANTIAISEGASGAPVNSAAWHPYDQLIMGDGNNGLIYSNAVDGNVSTQESPTFEDGYEYRFFMEEFNGGGAGDEFQIEFFRETTGSYVTSSNTLALGGNSALDIYVPFPRFVKRSLFAMVDGFDGTGLNQYAARLGNRVTTAQKISKVRFGFTGIGITSGDIYMLRRRVDFEV